MVYMCSMVVRQKRARYAWRIDRCVRLVYRDHDTDIVELHLSASNGRPRRFHPPLGCARRDGPSGRRTAQAASLAAGLDHHRPHSALADRTPAEFAAVCSGGKDGGEAALENAARYPPAGNSNGYANSKPPPASQSQFPARFDSLSIGRVTTTYSGTAANSVYVPRD
jgi:hypothetical protein